LGSLAVDPSGGYWWWIQAVDIGGGSKRWILVVDPSGGYWWWIQVVDIGGGSKRWILAVLDTRKSLGECVWCMPVLY